MSTKHFFIKYYNFIIEGLVVISLIVLAILLLKNISFFPVPNSDIVQYVCDAREYFAGRLPKDIHPAPGYSLLIGLVAPLFFLFERPELKAAIALNIMGVVGALYLLWRITAETFSKTWAVLLSIFLIINPLIYVTALNTTPEPLMTLSVLLAVYVYEKNKRWGYVLATIAFFIRYESIFLFITFGLFSFFQNIKQKKVFRLSVFYTQIKQFLLKNKVLCFCALLIFSWLLLTYFVNSYNRISFGNTYVFEIFDRKNDLPEWRFITHIIPILLGKVESYYPLTTFKMLTYVTNFLLVFAVTYFSFKKGSTLHKNLTIFMIGYSIIHIFFPAYNVRYFLPVFLILPFLMLSLFAKLELSIKTPFLVKALVLLLIVAIAVDGRKFHWENYLEADRYYFVEYKWAATWFKQQDLGKDITVITDYSHILSFYLGDTFTKPYFNNIIKCYGNPYIHNTEADYQVLSFIGNKECKEANCFLKKHEVKYSRVFIVLTKADDPAIEYIDLPNKHCYVERFSRIEPEHELQIYEYNPQCIEN